MNTTLSRYFIPRYLLSSSRRSVVRTMALLSVIGVGIGVLAMVVVLSVMSGFDESSEARLIGVEPHVVAIAPPADGPRITDIVQKAVGKKNAQVESFSRQDIVVRTSDGVISGAEAQGLLEPRLQTLGHQVVSVTEVNDTAGGGVASASHDDEKNITFQLKPDEIMMGVDLARSLGVFDGDEVTVIAPESLLAGTSEIPLTQKVHVRALVRTDVPDLDSREIFFDVNNGLRRFRETSSLQEGFEIRLKHADRADRVAEKLKEAGFSKVETWQTRNSSLFYSLKMEKSLMTFFLALTILVSSFSVVSVLVLLVTEKRRDVGVLKAIGATPRQIRGIFLNIGVALGMVGVGAGALLGLIICFVFSHYDIIRLPDIYYDTSIPVKVEFGSVVLVIVLGLVLSLAGSFFPAARIAEQDPVASLRAKM